MKRACGIGAAGVGFAILVLGGAGAGVCPAAAFANLDFEQAQVTNVSGTMGLFIEPGPALPDWTPMEDSNPVSQFPTTPLLPVTYIELVTSNAIEGNYSVELSGYGPTVQQSASISQTADVPAGTETIDFLVRNPSPGGAYDSMPTLSMNGTVIPIVQESNVGGVLGYAADISGYAGATQTLTFAAIASGPVQNVFDLDAISFSATPIPEPMTGATMLICATLLATRRRRTSASASRER